MRLFRCLSLMGVALLMACQDSGVRPDQNTADRTPESNVEGRMSRKEAKAVEAMSWVEGADPVADARAALRDPKSIELLAFASRALSFPGLSAEQYAEISKRVRYRVVQGAGDVLYGQAHRAMRRKVHAYATVYNAEIYRGLIEN
ncbi:MAG: hypothetical protein AAF610_01845 [Pseudomonadota bacterium]